MKKIIILVVIVLVLLFLSVRFFKNTNKTESNNTNVATEQTKTISNQGYQSQVDDQAAVTVDIRPKSLALGQTENIFAVSFNTHSVAMDYDFSQVITLRDDLDNVYQVQEWTGGQGGHHVSGDLVFPALNPEAQSVALEIVGVGGVDRFFNWEIL